jgi:hypothetical protein
MCKPAQGKRHIAKCNSLNLRTIYTLHSTVAEAPSGAEAPIITPTSVTMLFLFFSFHAPLTYCIHTPIHATPRHSHSLHSSTSFMPHTHTQALHPLPCKWWEVPKQLHQHRLLCVCSPPPPLQQPPSLYALLRGRAPQTSAAHATHPTTVSLLSAPQTVLLCECDHQVHINQCGLRVACLWSRLCGLESGASPPNG